MLKTTWEAEKAPEESEGPVCSTLAARTLGWSPRSQLELMESGNLARAAMGLNPLQGEPLA